MNGRVGIAAAVGIALLATAGPVQASPWRVAPRSILAQPASDAVDPEAIAAYDEGSNAYAMGNYEDAVTHFERAFELSRRSELLFNLGQAYSRWYEISGDIAHLRKGRQLLENYLSFLDEHPDQADPESRRQSEQRLEEVDRLIAAHDDGTETDPGPTDTKKPVHQKAWFWVAVVGGAAVIAGAVTTAVVLGRRNRDEFDPELGTIGRGVMPGGLGFYF